MIATAPHSHTLPARPESSSGVSRFHVLPGRLRLTVPGMKRNPDLCDAVVAAARALPGVRQAEGNVWTGRVLVLFDAAVLSAGEVEAAVSAARDEALRQNAAFATANGRERLAGRSSNRKWQRTRIGRREDAA